MNNTIQLYIDDDKEIKGYPITSPDRVVDENGKSVQQEIKKINVQLDEKASKQDVAKISSGTPLFADSVEKMTDKTKNYVNTTDGYLYIIVNGNFEKTNILYQSTGIGNKSIARSKLAFYELSEKGNWFVKENMISGYYYNTNGEKVTDSSIKHIEFIIEPKKVYKFNFDSYITYWNNDTFISGYLQSSLLGVNKSILQNIPATANKVKMSVFKEAFDYAKFTLEEYYTDNLTPIYIDKNLLITKANLSENITFEKETIEGLALNPNGNLIDINKLIKNKYYNTSGELVTHEGVFMVELNINSSNSYTFNFESHITYWGENDTFLKGYIQTHCTPESPQKLKDIPGNAIKVRMLVFEHAVNKAVFSLTTCFTNNLKCNYYIPGVISDINNTTDNTLYEYGNLLEVNKLIKGLVLNDGRFDSNSNDFTTDFLEIKDYKFDFVSYITFWNKSRQYVGGYIAGSVSPQYPVTLDNKPDSAEYVRFTVFAKDLDTAVLALTNTYKSNLKTYYYQENIITADENVSGKLENNPLFGKSFLFTGDSWCAGNTSAPGGWASWLKKKHPSITIKNCGIHGQDWVQGYNHWIANKENWNSLEDNYDYIIMEAYTNGLYVDIDQVAKPLGTINEFVYYNSDEEIKTALGDTYACYLELFISNMAKRYHGKKKMLMFPYKAVDHNRENNAFRKFRSEVIKCANKYNIKVFDNFNGCNIPTWSQEMIDTYFFNDGGHGDRVHLNNLGYDIICPPMEASIRML